MLDPGPQCLDVREDVGVGSGDRRGFGIFTLAFAAENTMQLPHAVVVAAHEGRAEVGLQFKCKVSDLNRTCAVVA